MPEETIYKGKWWLSGNDYKEISGQLNISSNNEAMLELQVRNELRNQNFIPIILGMSGNNRITLYNCQLANRKIHSSGLQIHTFRIQIAFIGVHFDTENEMRFSDISVCYSNLDEWVNRIDFHVDSEPNGKLTIQFQPSQIIEAKLDDYIFAIRVAFPRNIDVNNVSVTQKAYIDISSEPEKHISSYLNFIYSFRNFLSLTMGFPTYPLEINGKTDANKEILDDGKEFYTPVGIRCRIPKWAMEVKSVFRSEMLFTLPDILSQFNVYLCNWFHKMELFKPVYDLFSATQHNPYLYTQDSFINLIQAIETYHRRKYDGKYQSDEDYRNGLYKEFLKVIPPNLDSDSKEGFKESLKTGKLMYANEYSLRKRLQEITERISSDLQIGIFSQSREGELKSFIEKVHNTRNYLTHYTPELQSKAIQKADELYQATQRLRVILEVCLLDEVGFSFDEIKKAFSKYPHIDRNC